MGTGASTHAPLRDGAKLVSHRRFYTLDGLRGVGALMVMLFHVGLSAPMRYFGYHFYEGFLAVDLFYVLSGVVIADAYSGRLEAGLSLSGFLKIRIIRFYPLYAVGAVLAIALRFFDMRYGGNTLGWTPGALFGCGVLTVLMLPTPFTPLLYPLLPAWTLAYELLVNLLWARLKAFLRPVILGTVVVLAGVGFAYLVNAGGSNGGMSWGWIQAGFGTCRVLYSFGLGLVIQRMDKVKVPKLNPWIVLLLAFLVLSAEPSLAWRPVYEMVAVLVLLPCCVLLGAVSESSGDRQTGFLAFLGATSYGIYILHVQILLLSYWAFAALHLSPSGSPMLGLAAMAAVVALAGWLDQVWDGPVRRRLSRIFAPAG
ncbi:MAG TPA: acyltransferase [bacterium]|jgi:peptidoglycan/LPS O-acetylase OafA/YrhL|nr:acyltransferase [bacterium]